MYQYVHFVLACMCFIFEFSCFKTNLHQDVKQEITLHGLRIRLTKFSFQQSSYKHSRYNLMLTILGFVAWIWKILTGNTNCYLSVRSMQQKLVVVFIYLHSWYKQPVGWIDYDKKEYKTKYMLSKPWHINDIIIISTCSWSKWINVKSHNIDTLICIFYMFLHVSSTTYWKKIPAWGDFSLSFIYW